jgi:uncharacterized protein (TIGR03067 family)
VAAGVVFFTGCLLTLSGARSGNTDAATFAHTEVAPTKKAEPEKHPDHPTPPLVHAGPEKSSEPTPVNTVEAAAKKELGQMAGLWQVVRYTQKPGAMLQCGIGHYSPDLFIGEGEFRWTGHICFDLLDPETQRDFATIDATKNSEQYRRKADDLFARWQQSMGAIPNTWTLAGGTGPAVNDALAKEARERAERGEQAVATLVPTRGETRAIDFKIQGGALDGKIQKGIYRMDADTLEICVNGPATAERPSKFSTHVAEDGSGSVEFLYRRSSERKLIKGCVSKATEDGGAEVDFE